MAAASGLATVATLLPDELVQATTAMASIPVIREIIEIDVRIIEKV
jgi:hypothetical protein